MPINLQNAEFIKSAVNKKEFLRDGMVQVAFAGRSNVGKSSVINRLVNRKNLAYVGASPGKTTQINYFLIDKKAYLQAMRLSTTDSLAIRELLRGAMTDQIHDREIFMKGIDYSYYYEQED